MTLRGCILGFGQVKLRGTQQGKREFTYEKKWKKGVKGCGNVPLREGFIRVEPHGEAPTYGREPLFCPSVRPSVRRRS